MPDAPSYPSRMKFTRDLRRIREERTLTLEALHAETKIPLRDLVQRHIHREVAERHKLGFGVPIDQWLRGPLRDWAEDLLNEKRLTDEGYFHPKPIRETWEAHLTGRSNHQYLLWDVLMFQAWLEEQGLE